MESSLLRMVVIVLALLLLESSLRTDARLLHNGLFLGPGNPSAFHPELNSVVGKEDMAANPHLVEKTALPCGEAELQPWKDSPQTFKEESRACRTFRISISNKNMGALDFSNTNMILLALAIMIFGIEHPHGAAASFGSCQAVGVADNLPPPSKAVELMNILSSVKGVSRDQSNKDEGLFVYIYDNVMHGFSAKLTQLEVDMLKEMSGHAILQKGAPWIFTLISLDRDYGPLLKGSTFYLYTERISSVSQPPLLYESRVLACQKLKRPCMKEKRWRRGRRLYASVAAKKGKDRPEPDKGRDPGHN